MNQANLIPVDIERIITAVCDQRKLHYKGVIGHAATMPYVIGRSMAVSLIKHFKPTLQYTEIAAMFNRNKTFPFQAQRALKTWCNADRMLKRDFNLITLKIQLVHNHDH